MLKRAIVHFGIGGIAVVTAIASASPAFAGSADVHGSNNGSAVQQSADAESVSGGAQTTAATEAAVTSYATETWWKAGIEEYDLVEYTAQQIGADNGHGEISIGGVSYPSISFTVTAAEGKSAAQPIIYPHVWVGTRDISKEYYTVKSVDTGAIISSNAFDLVCRVLNAEMGSGYPLEALKAQAVAIYSYIRFCDANGMLPVVAVSSGYDSRIEQAVRSVEGQICTYGGSPIDALFCASTAGNSQGSEYVWGKSLPYLKAVECKYDHLDSNYGVKTSYTAAQIKSMIESKTDIVLDPDDVENWFEITSRTYGKYVDGIKIAGRSSCKVQGKTTNLTAAVLRASIMGNSKLRSTAFDISYSNGVFTFTTYGFGHGVGMSQRGAQMLANKEGLKYDQILKYYYTGIAVQCSSVNGKAEDRYGQVGDISGLEEASPSGDFADTAKDELSDDGEESKADNSAPGKSDGDSKAEATVTDTTTAATSTEPEASQAPEETEQTTPTVTTVPEVTQPPEPAQSETQAGDNGEPYLE